MYVRVYVLLPFVRLLARRGQTWGPVSSLAHYIRIQSIAFEQNPILHLQYIVHTHPMYVRAQHKHRLLWANCCWLA